LQSFPLDTRGRLVRVLLNSSSDRRVLDRAGSDRTQSARHRQSIQKQLEGPARKARTLSRLERTGLRPAETISRVTSDTPRLSRLQPPLSTRYAPQAVIPIQPIHCEPRQGLAISLPARLAFQLEAQLGHITIFINVFGYDSRPTMQRTPLQAPGIAFPDWRSLCLWQTPQERTSTQWQKN
jgi:hypothetical protein